MFAQCQNPWDLSFSSALLPLAATSNVIFCADLFHAAAFSHLFCAFLGGIFGYPSQPARTPIVYVRAWSWGEECLSYAEHLDGTDWSLVMDGWGEEGNEGKMA